MSENSNAGKIQSKIKIVDWESIANDNTLAHDYFKDADEALNPDFRDYDRVRVIFPKSLKTFGNMKEFEFDLSKKFKTIGTYVTKLNKIASDVNPESRKPYATALKPKNAKIFSIRKISESELEISKIENSSEFAKIKYLENGNCEISVCGNFDEISNYLIPLTTGKFESRLNHLLQIDAENRICENPKFYLVWKNEKFEIGESIPSDLKSTRIQFVKKLLESDYEPDLSEIMGIEPSQFGGGTVWLSEFLISKKILEKSVITRKY